MADFDVFNGDADGILSLVQLRLSEPRNAKLVTGRKRDIQLLSRVDAVSGDRVTVLDISMKSNKLDLERILAAGAEVTYFDHHNAGEIPKHHALNACIDTSPEVCTAMLVDEALGGAHRAWAVTAAFGDNFPELATRNARDLNFPLDELARLGMLINYNGYGADLKDLHIHPAELYRDLVRFHTPMAYLKGQTEIFAQLNAGFCADKAAMQSGEVIISTDTHFAVLLPNQAASRRMSGIFGNQLAQDHAARAHAVLTEQPGGFLVSLRAPLQKRFGADHLALQFKSGGGRSAAAGINHLPTTDLERFITAFKQSFL